MGGGEAERRDRQWVWYENGGGESIWESCGRDRREAKGRAILAWRMNHIGKASGALNEPGKGTVRYRVK